VLGVLVTVSSIGAGAVGATLILILYPELKSAEVAGTDIAYAVPLTAVAGLGHMYLGTIDWNLLVSLLVGSIPGIWLGARLSKSLPERLTRGALAATLTVTAIKLVS
ncbi:membrane protein, partial [Ralstonia solanacearum]